MLKKTREKRRKVILRIIAVRMNTHLQFRCMGGPGRLLVPYLVRSRRNRKRGGRDGGEKITGEKRDGEEYQTK